jgi:hypothetical protein
LRGKLLRPGDDGYRDDRQKTGSDCALHWDSRRDGRCDLRPRAGAARLDPRRRA